MRRRQYVRTSGAVLAGLVGGAGAATAASDGRSDVSGTERTPVRRRRTRLQEGAGNPPEPIETRFYGTGVTIRTPIRIERDGPAVFRLNYPGSGTFVVEVLRSDGTRVEQVLNMTGPWSGEIGYHIDPGEYDLRIRADGRWSLTLVQQPLYELGDFETQLPVELSGSDPIMYGPVDFSEPRTLSFTASGDDPNVLILHDASGAIISVLVYETAPVDTTVNVDIVEDVGWVSVDTDPGQYTLKIE